MQQRQIVLDTETTGLETADGHRVIEIGGVEIVNRRLTGRHFHEYLNPDRAVDPEAFKVHGIGDDFLADKPRFRERVDAFVDFISGAELLIHNAPFDVGFIDHELALLGRAERVAALCRVTDTLALARAAYPSQRNSLDALCKRLNVSNSQRALHGALLDAEILADVYLAMTGGQVGLALGAVAAAAGAAGTAGAARRIGAGRAALPVIAATGDERAAHEAYLQRLERGGGRAVWKTL